MFRWLTGKGASQRALERTASALTPELWQQTVSTYPFLSALNEAERADLHARTVWVLASKVFTPAGDLELTDTIRVAIAAQAALPILCLPVTLYEGWHEIIVYPGGFLIPRQDVDEAGVVHEYVQEAAGEAWDGGPMVLSWDDVQPHEERLANVVIHEFAHKLDLHAGEADGMPSLAGHADLKPRLWQNTLEAAWEDLVARLDAVERSIPPHIDPESEAADRWYRSLPIDPYAATDPAEFFAVSAEAFFVDPSPLAAAWPQWYDLLRRYFRQDPLQRHSA